MKYAGIVIGIAVALSSSAYAQDTGGANITRTSFDWDTHVLEVEGGMLKAFQNCPRCQHWNVIPEITVGEHGPEAIFPLEDCSFPTNRYFSCDLSSLPFELNSCYPVTFHSTHPTNGVEYHAEGTMCTPSTDDCQDSACPKIVVE